MLSSEHCQQNSPKEFAKILASLFPESEIEKALGNNFQAYQDDPAGFGEEVLGETYTADIKRMMESVRDNPVTIAKSANATGKTHGAARVAVWFYKSFPGAQVYSAAAPPESNLKRLLWGEIHSIIDKHPEMFEPDTLTNLNVARTAKSFIAGVTIPLSGTFQQREAKFSGKHAPYILFIFDEGDAIPDEVYRGAESCMSGGLARMLIMFNPRAETGEVYRMERDRRANVVQLSALKHPNVVTGRDRIPGAVTRETTVRRINEWCRPLLDDEPVTSDCFELPAFLEEAVAQSQSGKEYPPLRPGYYKIMEPAFSYMVLGQYPAQGANQLISKEWIARARTRWDLYVAKYGEVPPKYVKGIMGLDVADEGDDINAECCRYGGYVERLRTWGGVDTMVTGDRAADDYKGRSLSHANVDATGVGAGVAPHMARQGCSASKVMVASRPTERTELGEFKILRDQLWWACREWLRTDKIAMLPPDEELMEELAAATYEDKDGRIRVMPKAVMKELLKRSSNKADALCLTFARTGAFAGCDLS